MYQREVLGLEEVRVAIDAVLAEASKEPDRPVAVAVVDDRGDLIYFARMDKSVPLVSHMAIHKAYTAARMRRHTLAFKEWMRQFDWHLGVWDDNSLTEVQGGVCITKPAAQENAQGLGTVLGGIGVSGRAAEEDEQLAFVGLGALHL